LILLFLRVNASAEAPASLDDRAALEAWLDGTMNAMLEAHHCAGAVVAVVRNGQVALTKGYGYADLKTRKPVDPAATLFRIGSVSKLLVWTSVMQMIEQGKLDLDTDVNAYLTDVKVPNAYGTPVTMKNLMTHAAGFEDQVIGLFSHDPKKIRPLGQILREEMPARVRQPGVFVSYSNHGTGLAMHVVEQISGEPWEQYLQAHILDPLGLKHTLLAQPLPTELAAAMSKGYRFEAQAYEEREFELVPLGPVGGVSTTASDMAALMTAFLNYGEYRGARILKEESARTMQTPLHTMAPGINPLAHGMIDISLPGVRIVGHGGDTIVFHTLFALMPEQNTGLFASFNTDAGAVARDELLEAFARRYFVPNRPERPTPAAGFAQRASKYTGSYRVNRFSHHSLARLATAIPPLNVTYDGKDALKISAFGNKRWMEVASHTFQEEDGSRRMIFIEDKDGKINHFSFSELGIIAFERNGSVDVPEIHYAALAATLVLCLTALICWPVSAVVRWKHGVIKPREDLIPVWARMLGWIACVSVPAFILVFGGAVGDPTNIAFGLSKTLAIVLWIPLVIGLLAVAMVLVSICLWMAGRGSIWARIGYSMVTLALVVFTLQMYSWNVTSVQNYRFL
jgi:CubicO group peptidase (beta-lactamase class C family)